MSRDDPAKRFELAVQVPYFARWLHAGVEAFLAMPGPVDRVLVASTSGLGLTHFEQVPSSCGWPDDPQHNPVALAADRCARHLGVGISLRLEKGLSTGTGLCDRAALVAAVGAVHALCNVPLDIDVGVAQISKSLLTAVLTGRNEAAPAWSAAAVVFADTKASKADFEAGASAALEAGASEVSQIPPSTIVAGCTDKSVAQAAREALIESLAQRGIWSRGRAGELADRKMTTSRLRRDDLAQP